MSKRIVIHHDDLGTNAGANAAFVELCDLGVCTSGSVMVPCPWFPDMVRIARERPDLDLGVHLTLTAEFSPYRWRPLTGVADNGITDPDGFFWRDVESARRARPEAVEAELRAQIDTAFRAGIDVTHLDSHMGTVMMPEFLDIYLRLGAEYRLPILLPRNVLALAPPGTYDAAATARYEAAIEALVATGNPDFTEFVITAFGHQGGDVEPAYRAIFAGIGPGLTWGAFHFNAPGDIENYSDDAPLRIAEYELFRAGRARALMDEAGLELVGMRAWRERMRAR
jgi:chitin disaccharide deacetylase